jgi:methyl-accepting chemotaxis protein
MSLANMRIGARMVVGFSAILLLTVVIGLTAVWSVKSITSMTDKVLRGDAKILEHAQRARANVNALRRYEKFLH